MHMYNMNNMYSTLCCYDPRGGISGFHYEGYEAGDIVL
jgi:hypothetical protein